MKAHRYFAILVFVLSAIWVLTGEFSSVGSATGEAQAAGETETLNSESQKATGQEASDGSVQATDAEKLQTVGFAVAPNVQHARSVRISGVTEADKVTDVTARLDGIIATLEFAQGAVVKKGDVIATLDPEGRAANLRSAEQLVEQRKAEAVSREQLVKRGTLPKLQLDQVVSALRVAESQLEMAQAEMDRLVITAPFDGVLDVLNVEIGSAVRSGAPVARLVALDPIIGKGEVNERDLPLVRVGAQSQLRLVDGSVVEGTIRYISRVADPLTRTYSVEIEVANPDLIIPAGMTIEVTIKGIEVAATPVPRSVITLNDQGDLGVRALDSDDRVVFYPIDIVDDAVGGLMLGGIPAGARIIIVGQNFVADGQKVEPIAADEEALKALLEEARGGEVVAQ